ncbi:adenosylcobinamide-GDP ribazoletransferase [Aquimarina agarilytica]|uniref:adenosylcobinamide-GDP ribazoletransferase n=1 Tax=Aquimarina agarilytica TaxID=1087449 RepID=UPI000289B583|nr:adenosylcobinamide-GDP ribazoletransferase [Aquimarina agarilytica]
MKKEIHIFFTALMFFTRIPCPKWVNHDPTYLQKSSKYFPLVGSIVGGIGAFFFYVAQLIFSIEISLLISMASTIFITAGFHEDGFADVCDGFGGGWTKEKILMIMKDSRLGTYGVIGLILLLGIKFTALREMNSTQISIAIISAHALSRFMATTLLFTHSYVQDIEKSKIKPSAQSMTITQLSIAGIFGILPLLLFQNVWVFLIVIPAYISKMYLGQKFTKWIGGQTGDCAGAVQQLSEVVIYLSLVALWKFI